MPNPQDDATNLFLECYGDYIKAKDKKNPHMTWLKAVHCRGYLQELTLVPHKAPKKEEDVVQDIFGAFVTKEQAADIYRDLYDDSRSYPQREEK
jgi:hypothetical protein